MTLSEYRARAVSGYLRNKGVLANQITTKWEGATQQSEAADVSKKIDNNKRVVIENYQINLVMKTQIVFVFIFSFFQSVAFGYKLPTKTDTTRLYIENKSSKQLVFNINSVTDDV